MGPLREHAPNGNGTTFDETAFGGKTRRPAAVTGRQIDGENTPTSMIRNTTVAVAPLPSVTLCGAGGVLRAAGRPRRRPLRSTPDTPGKPNSVHLCPDWFVK